MRSLKIFAATIAVAALPAVAIAKAPAKDATSSSAAIGNSTSAVAKKYEEKVCRRIARTESRLTKRYCFTRAEWKKIDAE